MAKRFYISPVIGNGTLDNAYRAALSDVQRLESGSSLVSLIPSKPDGTPKFAFCLCIVNAANHVALGNVTDADQFPDITLDSQLSVLTTQQKNALLNFAARRGIPTTGLNNSSTFRNVLERIGQFLDLNFSALNFDAN